MIEGIHIRLRAWQESDLPTITTLRNDIALQSQLLARPRGNNQQRVQQWLQERSASADSMLFIAADRATDAPLGYLQFVEFEPIDCRAELGICLARNSQGKRIGQEALKLVLPYLRNYWGLRKVSLRVRADNSAAIHCYERVGFKQCGLLREHIFIDGMWNDVVLMDIFLTDINERCE